MVVTIYLLWLFLIIFNTFIHKRYENLYKHYPFFITLSFHILR
jgi:hypothetical protein